MLLLKTALNRLIYKLILYVVLDCFILFTWLITQRSVVRIHPPLPEYEQGVRMLPDPLIFSLNSISNSLPGIQFENYDPLSHLSPGQQVPRMSILMSCGVVRYQGRAPVLPEGKLQTIIGRKAKGRAMRLCLPSSSSSH